MHSEEQRYLLIVDYKEFLTRFDVDELMSSIDRIIEHELITRIGPKFLYIEPPYAWPYPWRQTPLLSYIGISSVRPGSLILEIIVSSTVVAYVLRRFKKGVDESILAEEIQRSGLLAGDFIGNLLAKINNWAERYVRKQQELGGNIEKIRIEKKGDDIEKP